MFIDEVKKNTQKIKELYNAIREAFIELPHGPKHTVAAKEFHSRYDELAYPGGLERVLKSLKDKDYSVVDNVIEYLKVDPFFYRSGYSIEKMIMYLKHFVLNDLQEQEVSKLILRSIENGPRSFFLRYVRLARRVNPELLLPGIRQVMSKKDNTPRVMMRAQLLLARIGEVKINMELIKKNSQ